MLITEMGNITASLMIKCKINSSKLQLSYLSRNISISSFIGKTDLKSLYSIIIVLIRNPFNTSFVSQEQRVPDIHCLVQAHSHTLFQQFYSYTMR